MLFYYRFKIFLMKCFSKSFFIIVFFTANYILQSLHGPEASIGWFKMDRIFRIPLVAAFATDHSLKPT